MARNGSITWAMLLDFIERAGWSAGQVFFATLLAGGAAAGIGNLPWKYSLSLALGAGVSSMVLTAIQYLARITNVSFWPDLLIRLAKTFLASLAASFAAADVFNVMTFHWTAALNVAFLATLSALAKGILARTAPAGATTQPANPSTLAPQTYKDAVGTTSNA